MPKGFFDPENAAKSTGLGFREGNIRVDKSTFRVHQGRSGEGQPERTPVTALMWGVTRLDEDMEPLVNEDGESMTEEFAFSLGGKSLSSVHPGAADSPEADDEDIEDVGDEVNADGPTIKLINTAFRPHEKSSVVKLFDSLKKAGYKQEYIDRGWAPDFTGLVCFMKSEVDETMPKTKYTDKNGKDQERPVSYKVVDRIVTAPYEAKAKSKASAKGNTAAAAKSSSTDVVGKNAEAEAALKPILEKLSTDKDGSVVSRKAFNTLITTSLQITKVNPKLHVPVLSLVKDDKWLTKNGGKYDISFDAEAGTVTFGTVEENDAE